jgi:ATP-dependent RNA circularization protein (DNA/RNA ligase family)
MGPSDSSVAEGQARIATVKKRDKHDMIIVQEKLDGSCVGVARKEGKLLALTKKGWLASSSRFDMHLKFAEWVEKNQSRFLAVLNEGERLCGEWLIKAHGTMYDLPHEPFVAFDIFDHNRRLGFEEFRTRVAQYFVMPYCVSVGESMSVVDVLSRLGEFGYHGAKEQIEGAVWRVERKEQVDFLCKYVRPDKIDGKYLDDEFLMNMWTGEL